MFEVLLCRSTRQRKKVQHEEHVQKTEKYHLARLKAALNGSVDRAENRGFRMVNGSMATYDGQQKLTLSA